MKGLEKFFLLAFIGLIVLGLWNYRGWVSQHIPSSLSEVLTPTQPTVSAPPKLPAKPVEVHRRVGGPNLLSDIPVSVVDVPFTGPRFPEPGDFPPGTSSTQIRANFGEPSARVTEALEGTLVEKYYYFDKIHRRLTWANLRDGVVVSAKAKSL